MLAAMGLNDTSNDDDADDEPWFLWTGFGGSNGIIYPVSDKGVAFVVIVLAVAGVSYAVVRAGWISPLLLIALEALPAFLAFRLAARHTDYDDPGAADTRSDDDMRSP
jgi:hypothetical protein